MSLGKSTQLSHEANPDDPKGLGSGPVGCPIRGKRDAAASHRYEIDQFPGLGNVAQLLGNFGAGAGNREAFTVKNVVAFADGVDAGGGDPRPAQADDVDPMDDIDSLMDHKRRHILGCHRTARK